MKLLIMLGGFLISFSSLASPASLLGKIQIDKSLVHKSSFEMTWERYPSPDIILTQLNQYFPLNEGGQSLSECQSLTPLNRTVLGDNNVVSGEPLISNPNSSFVVWYSGCIKQLLDIERMVLYGAWGEKSQEANLAYFGDELLEFCTRENKEQQLSGEIFSSCVWDNLPNAVKMNKISSLVFELIGPDEVLSDLGIAPSVETLAKVIFDEIESYSANRDQRYKFVGTDESVRLNVTNAIQISKFLILMADVLRY